MTFKCNGCGGSFEWQWLGGVYSYGDVSRPHPADAYLDDVVAAAHHKTFCVGCARVMKSMMLNSDLSEHWENENLPEEFIDAAE